MKNYKKVLGMMVLCACVAFTAFQMPATVYAMEDGGIDSRMTYISSYTTDLYISSTGVASVSGSVRGKSGVTSTYVKCTLQMSVGGGWADVKSWEASSSNWAATIGETYQLSSRGTYRVYMECSANTEEKTLTSAYRTY